MCTNPKHFIMQGIYKEDLYGDKLKGVKWSIDSYFPCGECNQDYNSKSNNWVQRAYYESKSYKEMCFITLTYDKNNYPFIPLRKDMTLFIKRLRRRLEYHYEKKIRYFYVMEYGKRTSRIHFHIIIFGWEPKKEELTLKGKNKKGNLIYESETIKKLWKYGIHTVQMFEKHEIPYIALYNSIKSDSKKYLVESRETLIKLKKLLKSNKAFIREEVLDNIIATQNKIVKERKKWIKLKEFNGWSQGLGFENFKNEYDKESTHIFKSYFDNRTLLTPSPWLKKLAIKYNDNDAIEELKKRSEYVENQIKSVVERNTNDNILKEEIRLKKDLLSHNFEKEEL